MATLGEVAIDEFNRLKYADEIKTKGKITQPRSHGFDGNPGRLDRTPKYKPNFTLEGGPHSNIPARSTIPKSNEIALRGARGVTPSGPLLGRTIEPLTSTRHLNQPGYKPNFTLEGSRELVRSGVQPNSSANRIDMDEAIRRREKYGQPYSSVDKNQPVNKTHVQDNFNRRGAIKNPNVKIGERFVKGANKVLPAVPFAIEGYDAYKDNQIEGMTGLDQTARYAEGAGRAASATTGAMLGASAGSVVPVAGTIVGGLAGGALGYLAPDAAKEIYNYFADNDIQLPSEKADYLIASMNQDVSGVNQADLDAADVELDQKYGMPTQATIDKQNEILAKYKRETPQISENPALPSDQNPQRLGQGSNQIYADRRLADNMNEAGLNMPVYERTTPNYRDAMITNDNSVSFGGGKGLVSGLNKEQAARIQSSLSQGRQVGSFGVNQSGVDENGNPTLFGRPAEQSRQSPGLNDSARAQVMAAMRSGAITADKADALLVGDTRAADRMDRYGGNSQSYIRPDASPTNITEAIAYGQNLNNFTRNGELNEYQALVAQHNYLSTLGGYKGIAGSAPSALDLARTRKINQETKNLKNKTPKFKQGFNDDFITTLPEQFRNNATMVSEEAVRELRNDLTELGTLEEQMKLIEEFSGDSKIPAEDILAYIRGQY